MDIVIAMLLGAFVIVWVTSDWRKGVYAILLGGFLQDSVRKLVTGQPVAVTAFVAGLMLCVWAIGLNQAVGKVGMVSLRRQHPSVANALTVYSGLVLFQSMLTVVNFGSIMLAVIGLIAYLSPLPAIWIGWRSFRTLNDIERWMQAYIVCGVIVAIGVYLSWQGVGWSILEQIGGGLTLYDPRTGQLVETHSGFMRAPEIAAWHLGATACFAGLLAVSSRSRPGRVVVLALAILAVIPAMFLTGRRKVLAMVGLFVGLLSILLRFSRNRDAASAGLAIGGLVLTALSAFFFFSEDASDNAVYQPYVARGESVFGDAWGRFYDLGLGSVSWAIAQAGFFGYGAGVVSQGGQYFGVNAFMAGAAEGGLGKIIMELGVPGLFVLAWVVWVIAGSVRKSLRLADRVAPTFHVFTVGLVAFLIVNAIIFVTAAQVFGDPFVLIMLGIVLGAILAIPRIMVRQAAVPLNASPPIGSASDLRASWPRDPMAGH